MVCILLRYHEFRVIVRNYQFCHGNLLKFVGILYYFAKNLCGIQYFFVNYTNFFWIWLYLWYGITGNSRNCRNLAGNRLNCNFYIDITEWTMLGITGIGMNCGIEIVWIWLEIKELLVPNDFLYFSQIQEDFLFFWSSSWPIFFQWRLRDCTIYMFYTYIHRTFTLRFREWNCLNILFRFDLLLLF